MIKIKSLVILVAPRVYEIHFSVPNKIHHLVLKVNFNTVSPSPWSIKT